ncbi:MAG: shikimate kinase [Acidimicrobiales bacterium]
MPPRKVVLVGMPGSGKTVVGTMLAERLACNFADVDALIESDTGMAVAKIFASPEFGEAGFRVMERDMVAKLVTYSLPAVIATGGGAIEDEATRRLLAGVASVVWLEADPEVLLARVGADPGRPLLASDPAGSLERLLHKRESLYRRVSDLAIDTGGLDVAQVVEKILDSLPLRAYRTGRSDWQSDSGRQSPRDVLMDDLRDLPVKQNGGDG